MRTLRLRIYPDDLQESTLREHLDLTRWLYNYFLGIIKSCRRLPEKSTLRQMIPALCRFKPELGRLYSTSRQFILEQLYHNITVQVANKKKVNQLRFKGLGRQRAVYFHQYGFKLTRGARQRRQMGKLRLGKVGEISCRVHRTLDGTIKQVCVKSLPSGRWYASLQIEQDQPINCAPVDKEKHVGLDMGIIHFVYDSAGGMVNQPHIFDKLAAKLAKEKRNLSRSQPNSRNRAKRRTRVARTYESIGNIRKDFLHNLSRHYIANFDVIGREELDIPSIIRALRSGKNVLDAAWGEFFRQLDYKAESASKLVVEVPSPNTSIECSGCHKMVPKGLAARTHQCSQCGLELDRDYNSAKVVDYRAVKKIGWEASE